MAEDARCERGECLREDAKEGDEEGLQGVTMDVGLGKKGEVGEIDVFDTFGGNVFALGKFEDVLHTVDDLESTEAVDSADVAGAEPTVRENGFACFFFGTVVAGEESIAAYEQFATWLRNVGYEIVH